MTVEADEGKGFDPGQMRADLARIRRRLERLSKDADDVLDRFQQGRTAAARPPQRVEQAPPEQPPAAR